MKGAIKTNFRGLRALVLHRDDMNRAELVNVLARLGLVVKAAHPSPGISEELKDFDLVLFDADEGLEWQPSSDGPSDIPLIALIGNEAPSRLARVVRYRCDSHIQKPVRSSGVFTALLLAVNNHEQRAKTEREVVSLRQRLSGRRVVMKAVLRRMSVCGVDEEAAYEWLRQEAMNRRLPIEELARESLGLRGAGGPCQFARTTPKN